MGWWRRLTNTFQRRLDREIDEELQFHIEMRADERGSGCPRNKQADRVAGRSEQQLLDDEPRQQLHAAGAERRANCRIANVSQRASATG